MVKTPYNYLAFFDIYPPVATVGVHLLSRTQREVIRGGACPCLCAFACAPLMHCGLQLPLTSITIMTLDNVPLYTLNDLAFDH